MAKGSWLRRRPRAEFRCPLGHEPVRVEKLLGVVAQVREREQPRKKKIEALGEILGGESLMKYAILFTRNAFFSPKLGSCQLHE